jgi:cold shock CspA family protein
MNSSIETSSSAERHTGRVKWFNSKTGYGFVTVTDGDNAGTDVFVHHSSVQVSKEQYRYLVQGEYIQFVLTEMSDGPHKYQATDVTGVNGGTLMCETLLETGCQLKPYRPRTQYSDDKPKRYEDYRDNERPRYKRQDDDDYNDRRRIRRDDNNTNTRRNEQFEPSKRIQNSPARRNVVSTKSNNSKQQLSRQQTRI